MKTKGAGKGGGNDNSPPSSDKPHGPTGNTDKTKTNSDGSPVQRDKNGKIDNDKNGKSDGSGIDVSSSRPKDPTLAAAYDEKKMLIAQGKADKRSAEETLRATLAEIKGWGNDGGKTGNEI